MKTLLVQDGTLRTVLGECVVDRGHDVTVCSGLHQAKQLETREFYPLVVTDLASVQDSLEFVRWWKGRNRAHWCFVLAVVPHGADVKTFIAAGVNDFLQRPYDSDAARIRLTALEEHIRLNTERERSEEVVRIRAQQQAAVAALGQAALAEDEPTLLELVSRFVVDTLEVEFCSVFELESDGKSLCLMAGLGWRPGWIGRSIPLSGPVDAPQLGLLGEDSILATLEETEGSADAEMLAEHGVASGIRVVVKGKQAGVLGILGAFTAASRTFREDDLHFLQGLANTVAAAIERRQADAEIRRHQEQVQHLQRLESVGQLSAALAHDYNNVLTVIHGHLTLSLGESDLPQNIAAWLRTALEAVEQASNLTQQLLSFSRKQTVRLEKLDLGSALARIQRLLRGMLGNRIKVEVQVSPALPSIRADERQLDQVLLNLAANARDAMPKGGTLLIQAAAEQVDTERVRHKPGAQAGTHVCLSVKDSGIGMDESTLQRVFEPFFTTKAAGKGTGLGLSTVYGIIRQHQGWVEAESTPGVGTTFRIYLPGMAEAVQPAKPEGKPLPEPAPRQLSILLVEDEPGLRQIARLLLEDMGHRVMDAASAAEALSIWEREQANLPILITDLVLPDATGLELARRLRLQRPGLKVVCTSGYSPETIRMEVPSDQPFHFMQKPYDAAALAKAIRACCEPAEDSTVVALH